MYLLFTSIFSCSYVLVSYQCMTSHKAIWSQLNQKSQNINEQNTLLLVNIRKCIKRMKNKKKSSSKIIQKWFQAYLTYFEDTQFSTINEELVKTIDFMINQIHKNQNKMKKKQRRYSSRHYRIDHFIQVFSFFHEHDELSQLNNRRCRVVDASNHDQQKYENHRSS